MSPVPEDPLFRVPTPNDPLREEEVEYWLGRTRFIPRRGRSESWSVGNPVLRRYELVIETDTGRAKVGDGIRAYRHLPYVEAIDEVMEVREGE